MTHSSDVTVLIVDDEVQLVDLYAAFLDPYYPIRTATGGEEALERADQDIDVVLLDRRMPAMSGDEVLEELRARGYTCQVAMLTGVKPADHIVDMPFDDYKVKPVGRADLVSLVEVLVERATFDETSQEFFRLASKKAALEFADNTGTDAYDEITERMGDLRDHLDGSLDGVTHLPMADSVGI